jgi:hypothetical protein
MNHNSTPAFIRWRGSFYCVRCRVVDNVVSVETEPANEELQEMVRASVEQDRFKQLAVYKGFGYDYLTNDPKRGE